MQESMRKALPQLALRIQATIRFRGKSSAKHNRPLRRRQTLLGRVPESMGIPTARDPVRRLLLRGNRRRNHLQRDAPDQQTRNIPTNLPQYHSRRDTPPRRHDGSSSCHGREVLGGTEDDDYPSDEAGLHLSLTAPLPAQARVLAPTRRL